MLPVERKERERKGDARVEGDADLGQEDLLVPAAERLGRRILDALEELAREHAGLGVEAGEGELVVLGAEVALLLLREEDREVRNDGCETCCMSASTSWMSRPHMSPRGGTRRRTVGRALHDGVDLALDADADVVVEDAHLAPDRDARPGERHERRRDVALPQVHDHVGEADDADRAQVGLGLAVVE